MAVEAIVNELYLERGVAGKAGAWFGGMSPRFSAALHEAWDSGVDRLSLLERCQLACTLNERPPLKIGEGPAQQLNLLIQLRNQLVHHKPESFEVVRDRQESDDKLNVRLRNSFDTAAIWQGTTVSFRWSGCLGGSCAAWAQRTSLGFQKEFFAHLGVSYPYDSVPAPKPVP